MSESKPRTIAELGALEKEKRDHLADLISKKAAEEVRRADLLLRLGEKPGDRGAKKDLETCDLVRGELAYQIEINDAILRAIPEWRNIARAEEIESGIEKITQYAPSLEELASRIDQTAEAFALAIKEYYAILQSLCDINPTAFHFHSLDIGALDSLGAFLRKHGVWRYVKVGVFRGAQTMGEKLSRNPNLHQIAVRVSRMQQAAARLRGEAVAGEYCPNCYGDLVLEQSGGLAGVNIYQGIKKPRRVCRDCGWQQVEQ